MQIVYQSIGVIRCGRGFSVELEPRFRAGLAGLEGFSHVLIFWHAHESGWEDAWLRVPKPYRHAPESLGVFATRSPMRPNALCQTVAGIAGVDLERGIIHLHYIDAGDGTPVLDIKPYLACCERPTDPHGPDWCRHWPANIEANAAFDWENEFLFNK